MNIELIAQNNEDGTIYDLSELVTDTSWETGTASTPGKLTFNYLADDKVNLGEGSVVSFKKNGQGVFYGYLFKTSKKESKEITITAYDQQRYLKNKDTYVLQGLTASGIFSKICSDFKLNGVVKNASSYIIPDKVMDSKTLFEIIQYGIDVTIINAAEWNLIRDVFGELQFINMNALKTDLFIGDESLLTGFTYESSIDDDTYNQVKLIKENTDTKKREIYIVKDSANISKWGTLQYFDKVDESANASQIKEKAEKMLQLKNRVTKKLKLDCLGDLRVSAGSGIVVGISALTKKQLATNQYYMVTNCTHNFRGGIHTMALEMQVSI